MSFCRLLGGALLLCLALLPPLQAQTLRWAARGDARSMDPHAALETVTININALVYDPLVTLDRQGRFVPALATGWTVVEPTLWRFTLRRGVRFQDGTPFTASDAVFSIERAQQASSQFALHARALGKAARIDDDTLELHQARPDPILLEHLAAILIMSRRWAEAHHAEQVPDLKNGQEAYSNRHAMGTGRYLLQQYQPGTRTLLERNPGWWGRFDGNVERIVYMPMANDATRTAALLAGDIDFMQDVPPQAAARLAKEPALRVLNGAENRLIYLGFDQFRDELGSAGVKGRNPFKDLRVRQAFFHAIDAEALKKNIMLGLSEPTGCVSASAAGCLAAPTDPQPPANLALARRLMAEAGYPKGFALTLDCPNDRYTNDRALCLAIGGMLSRIGIELSVDARPKAQYFPKLGRFDTSFFLHGYGQPTADAQTLLDGLVHSRDASTHQGDANYGRFADAELDRWLDAAGAETDPARRAAAIGRAQQLAADRHYLLPIHRQMLSWAMRSGVHAVMTPDNIVRADWIRVE